MSAKVGDEDIPANYQLLVRRQLYHEGRRKVMKKASVGSIPTAPTIPVLSLARQFRSAAQRDGERNRSCIH
jgi:hypothetical protein